MWDVLKRNWYEWNINCPIDSKNYFKEEHEVYQANYQVNKNTQLEVLLCEHCNYSEEKFIKQNKRRIIK